MAKKSRKKYYVVIVAIALIFLITDALTFDEPIPDEIEGFFQDIDIVENVPLFTSESDIFSVLFEQPTVNVDNELLALTLIQEDILVIPEGCFSELTGRMVDCPTVQLNRIDCSLAINSGHSPCFTNEEITLRSIVNYKDDTGFETIEVIDTGIGSFTLTKFASDKTNRPLQDGSLTYWLRLNFDEAKTNVSIEGTLVMKITDRLGERQEEFSISGRSATDEKDEIIVRIDTPSGTVRKSISSLVQNTGRTTIDISVKDVKITADGQSFSLTENVTIYIVKFDRTINKTIVENEQGKFVLVWATDDKLTINTRDTSNSVKKCSQYARYHGCVRYSTYTYKTLAPPMAGVEIFQNGKLIIDQDRIIGKLCLKAYNPSSLGCRIGSPNSVTTLVSIFIQRDADYKIVFDSSGGVGAGKVIEFHTPTTQKNYHYYCSTKGCNF